MKKVLVSVLIAMMVVLAACSSNATAAATQTTEAAVTTEAAAATTAVQTTGNDSILNTTYDSAVSVELQLALGTLNLDGTSNQVTKDQATSLLTLWQSIQSSTPANPGQGGGMPGQGGGSPQGTPDASAQQTTPAAAQGATNDNQTQVDALVKQIEAAMTTDQLKAIAAMQITQTSASTIMTAKGITVNSAQGNGGAAGTPAAGGNAPQGTPPASAGTQGASQQSNGQQPGNGQMGAGGNSMVQPEVMNALVQYLAKTAGVTLPTQQATASN
jgi:hypothetical protein